MWVVRPPRQHKRMIPTFRKRCCEFMRGSWRDSALDVAPGDAVANYAARRAALSAAFPGQTLVVPTGHERVRANDTNYPFRPGTDFVWLTGEHDPEAVLVMRPTGTDGHDATLYVRPRSPRDTDEFFRDRNHGELWIGRRQTLAENGDRAGHRDGPPVRSRSGAGRLRAPPVRVPCEILILMLIVPSGFTATVPPTGSSRPRCRSCAWSRTRGRSRNCRTRSTRPCAASRTWPGSCRPTAACPSD